MCEKLIFVFPLKFSDADLLNYILTQMTPPPLVSISWRWGCWFKTFGCLLLIYKLIILNCPYQLYHFYSEDSTHFFRLNAHITYTNNWIILIWKCCCSWAFRSKRSMKMNDASSRSHFFFTVYISGKNEVCFFYDLGAR